MGDADVNGNHDMMTEPGSATASTPRTTAVGLEAWLSGAHAETAVEDATLAAAPEYPSAATADQDEIAPVNAAEALALSRSAGTFSGPRKLVGPDGAELMVDPQRGVYYFESTALKPLAALLQQPASAWRPIPVEELDATHPATSPQPLERLRWYAGLVATPGILGRKLGRTTPYKLSRWPETEREYPRHFRIAKAMLHDPATIEEIVAASGMPHDDVVDYINASFASGRLETSAPRQAGEAPNASRKDRLLARLNKPLFAR